MIFDLPQVIQPATIFICEGGTYGEFKPVLLADLGLLTISTVDVDVKVCVRELGRSWSGQIINSMVNLCFKKLYYIGLMKEN